MTRPRLHVIPCDAGCGADAEARLVTWDAPELGPVTHSARYLCEECIEDVLDDPYPFGRRVEPITEQEQAAYREARAAERGEE